MSPRKHPAQRHPRPIWMVAVFLCLATASLANIRLTTNPSEDTSPCVDVGSDGLPRVAWSRSVGGQ